MAEQGQQQPARYIPATDFMIAATRENCLQVLLLAQQNLQWLQIAVNEATASMGIVDGATAQWFQHQINVMKEEYRKCLAFEGNLRAMVVRMENLMQRPRPQQ
ncbi:hypothetical protein FPSE_07023 [Fusarium pseudograminearum CS3096]|uniref:Uncharacterized protein n=1 Tax=Fusarium pseudograminearum (strain CS3096) TaxID=1028729 RepID=K3VF37_FUSPC|nr:hypothetical protein FPSE_07023 [Fusarium pseudograminearum CS3096]EKJ72757.1 hypothetical protein FPSE_07023 [Fusarium pseudograminearum CS3096]